MRLLFEMRSEQKIRDICTELLAVPEGSDDFWERLVELRDALEEHIARLRAESADHEAVREAGSRARKAG